MEFLRILCQHEVVRGDDLARGLIVAVECSSSRRWDRKEELAYEAYEASQPDPLLDCKCGRHVFHVGHREGDGRELLFARAP